MPASPSSSHTLSELEAQKKRLELERKMIQVELDLLNANQQIKTLQASQKTSGVMTSNVRSEDLSSLNEDRSTSERSQSSVSKLSKAIKRPMPLQAEDSLSTHVATSFLTLRIPRSAVFSAKLTNDSSMQDPPAPRRRQKSNASTQPLCYSDTEAPEQSLVEKARRPRIDPFAISPSPSPPLSISVPGQQQKRKRGPSVQAAHTSIAQKRERSFSQAQFTTKRASSILQETDNELCKRTSRRSSTAVTADHIDKEEAPEHELRPVPQSGYQIPEYHRMTASDKRLLELRYCAHILVAIQHKSCIRKPPLPLNKENLFDRCRRRFPDAVLASDGASDTEENDAPLKLLSMYNSQSLKDDRTNSLGEPYYRTTVDFLDHIKSILNEYVRMGTCENCPFARAFGKQSARVMCWRMRLESVIEEKMRGLKSCMQRCEELAGDLQGRKEVVDEWFSGVDDASDE